MDDLFSQQGVPTANQPLAERRRPKTLEGYLGQDELLGEKRPLRVQLDAGQIHSMVLWGPPGVGKTTLARLIAQYVDAEFYSLSAVLSGVKEVRDVIQRAEMAQQRGRKSILFIDEIHRFNKSQQDAFLPHVENGTLVLIGATTENPSFELNRALLSRCQVYRLKPLDEPRLVDLLDEAIAHDPFIQAAADHISQETRMAIASASGGDARRAYSLLESLVSSVEPGQTIGLAELKAHLEGRPASFDKGGDQFYELISALHKTIRGSDPDAALYWFQRMLQGGCEPLYIARRLVRMASEEVGNADPRALTLCLSAWDAVERLGLPEAELSMAQAVCYLAVAPKSNAVYAANNRMREIVQSTPNYPVPNHLCNAPTKLMKEQGVGDGYRYAHDEAHAFAAGEVYFPPELAETKVYEPVDRGLETKIKAKLAWQQEANRTSMNQRYPKGQNS